MNYYERIQRSIDHIESNLENIIDINIAAQMAFMSLSNFYRMFFALAGYSVKEYIRLRRISLAADEIVNGNTYIIDIAVKYDFESGDSFSRAFRRITGYLPSEFRRQKKHFYFERMNIMDKYFEIQDKDLLERYPDIKVLKELKSTRVVYYNFFGKNPEHNAFEVMKEWVKKIRIKVDEQNHRIFGYNNPSPDSDEQTEYGYELCITVDDNFEVRHPHIKTKYLEGGLYAVTSVKKSEKHDMGEGIMLAWKRFNSWLIESKYIYGGHQWLEEHLGFDEELNHTGGIDLYMPIKKKI
ncbi:MAG: DNA-binding protein AraC-type [Eubacterium sp.]|jgi:AraC-like DNA-binding protein/DNA gyrase inhibitor GyrI|nr:DNA-binding protein AraC-type [Eubacterium sp.]